MLLPQTNTLTYSVYRFFITTSVYNKNYLKRQGKFMRKLMHEDIPKKKWHTGKSNKIEQPMPLCATPITSPHVTRRVTVLNNLFMKYVTDLMATGEVSSEIVGKGIEVSQVKVANDFHVVRVYWFSSDTQLHKQPETAKLLQNIAYKLRHELSQLKVIGVVPPIQFVADKLINATVELEKRMLVADYGPDYVPQIQIGKPSAPELTLYTKLPNDVRAKILETGEENDEAEVTGLEEDDEHYDIQLPEMKHDVLDLNQWFIMSKVKQSLSKVLANQSQGQRIPSLDVQQQFDPKNIKILQTKEELQAFDDFLLKRQIEEKRRERLELRYMYSDVLHDENHLNEINKDWNEDADDVEDDVFEEEFPLHNKD